MSEIIHPLRTVVCHTSGCINEGVEITLACSDNVLCHSCNTTIEDVRSI